MESPAIPARQSARPAKAVRGRGMCGWRDHFHGMVSQQYKGKAARSGRVSAAPSTTGVPRTQMKAPRAARPARARIAFAFMKGPEAALAMISGPLEKGPRVMAIANCWLCRWSSQAGEGFSYASDCSSRTNWIGRNLQRAMSRKLAMIAQVAGSGAATRFLTPPGTPKTCAVTVPWGIVKTYE